MKNDIGIFILILSLMFMMNTCAGMKGIENSIDRLKEGVESGNSAVRQRDILSDAIRYKLDNDTVPMENVLRDMDIDIDDLMKCVYAY